MGALKQLYYKKTKEKKGHLLLGVLYMPEQERQFQFSAKLFCYKFYNMVITTTDTCTENNKYIKLKPN